MVPNGDTVMELVNSELTVVEYPWEMEIAFSHREKQNAGEEMADTDEEKRNARMEITLPDREKQNADEEMAFPDEEKRNARVEIIFPIGKSKMPMRKWHFPTRKSEMHAWNHFS